MSWQPKWFELHIIDNCQTKIIFIKISAFKYVGLKKKILAPYDLWSSSFIFLLKKKKSPVISHLLVTVCYLLTAFMTWIGILRLSGRDKVRCFRDADLLRDHRQINTATLLISYLLSSMSFSPTNSWQRLPWAMLSPASSIFFFLLVFKRHICLAVSGLPCGTPDLGHIMWICHCAEQTL